MALTDKLTAIADAIRSKTGKTDGMTLDQMPGEIEGIEAGGGSGGGASGIYMAKITPAEILTELPIVHNLGTTDIALVAVWVETLGDHVPTVAMMLAKFWVKKDVKTQYGGNGYSPAYIWSMSSNVATPYNPNSAKNESLTIIDGNNVILPRAQSGGSASYNPNVTYTVIVMAASAFTDMGV